MKLINLLIRGISSKHLIKERTEAKQRSSPLLCNSFHLLQTNHRYRPSPHRLLAVAPSVKNPLTSVHPMASSCDDDDDDNGFLFSPDDHHPNPNPNNHHRQYQPNHHHQQQQPPRPPSFLPRFPSKSPPVLPSSATAAASELAESGSNAPLHSAAPPFAADENFGSPTDPAKSRSDKRRSHEELSDGGTTQTSCAYKKSKAAGTAASSEYRKDREDWSDAAIACLLDVYAEKYASLNRGNLRGRDWEEVAAIVSERCEKHTKSVEQCKNKVDNLKKRFKLERHRMSNGGVAASQWPWYKKLEEIIGNMLPAKSATNEEKGGIGGGGGRGGTGEVSAAPARQNKR